MTSNQAGTKNPPKLVLGCAGFGSPVDPICTTTTTDQAAALFTTFISYGHHTVDTSRRYPPQAPGTSEELIGETLELLKSKSGTEGQPSILIDTKTLSAPGCHKPENLRASISDSLKALRVDSVHTIYLHFPDRTVPLSDPASVLSNAVKTGQAKQWGISNYTVDDIHELVRLCDENGWVKPAVYQGEYNALSRASEDLIRACHEQGIAFYAYSPGAGGVFSPSGSRMSAQHVGGDRMRALYGGEEMQSAVQKVRDVAQQKGLGGHEVAMRWAFWDGILDGKYGDGVIVGASSEKQLRNTCEFLTKGGLDDELRQLVDGIWATV